MIHILLPAYNEELALGLVLSAVRQVLAPGTFHVWVVDDGSKDGTARVAEDWRARIPLTLLRHEKNAGLGKAFQTGLSHIVPAMAPEDVLVTLDADNTQPVALIPSLAKPLLENTADIAIASRFVTGGEMIGVPFYRQLTSLGARILFSCFLPMKGVRDFTCGFRAFRGDILKRGIERWGALVTENGFAATLEWLVRLSVLSPRIIELPLVLRYDQKPTPSKMPVWQTIRRLLALLVRMRRLRSA